MTLQYKSKCILYNGCNEVPSKIEWDEDCNVPGWTIFIDIKFTVKGDIRTKFTVLPPIWMPRKDAKKLVFKTTSYVELKKWLKKHKITVKPL